MRAKIQSFLLWLVILVSTGLLAATVVFLSMEARWFKKEPPRPPQQAFVKGTIGTELIPLVVLEVLPDLFPDKFPGEGNWMKKYGLIPPGWKKQLLQSQSQGDHPVTESEGLPLGFTVSRLRPLSGYPSPVDFVGIGCATCHSTVIRRDAGDPGVVILGPGNSALNLLAFFENIKAAVLQREPVSDPANAPAYVLSIENVVAKQKQRGREVGLLDRMTVGAWINQAREAIMSDNAFNGEPRVGQDLYDSEKNRTGPMRTNPFRSLVKTLLDRPGRSGLRDDLDMGFVKLAAVFDQGGKEWAQFDGTVRKLYSRSALAALSAGATIHNLSQPEVIRAIKESTDYVETLSSPRWDEVFPGAKVDQEKARRGLGIYRQHCSNCHGYRDPDQGTWKPETAPGTPSRLGELIKPAEIQTDSERLTFAYAERLPQAFHDFFDKLPFGVTEGLPFGHPFALKYDAQNPDNGEIRAAVGYIASPIPGAFLRAPYLHNASILTMRELINLDARRPVFQRGANFYDTGGVGLVAPAEAGPGFEWKFDARLPGNSNKGHDYPWPYFAELSDEKRRQLEDLLEYLKTL